MTTQWVGLFLVVHITFVSQVLASGPLPVLYPDDQDDEIIESHQNHIDNQAYLREFERQRRERVLSQSPQPPVGIFSSRRERSHSYNSFGNGRPGDHGGNRFFGLEYQSGNTIIRYYDGYQPNCCNSGRYYVHPHPGPARTTPHRQKVSR